MFICPVEGAKVNKERHGIVLSTFTAHNDAQDTNIGHCSLTLATVWTTLSGICNDWSRPRPQKKYPPRLSSASANYPSKRALNVTIIPSRESRRRPLWLLLQPLQVWLPHQCVDPILSLERNPRLARARPQPTIIVVAACSPTNPRHDGYRNHMTSIQSTSRHPR
jgi:hypothetical protein